MVRRGIGRGLAAVGTWLVLCGGAVALGQVDPQDPFSGGGLGPSGGVGGGAGLILPLQILAFLLLSATAFALAFFVLFPMLLRRRHPSWPLEAYGFAWTCVLLGMSVAFLAIFWNDLVLTRFFPGAKTAVNDVVNHYSLKAAVVMVATVALVAVSSRFRSELRTAVRAGGAAR